MEFYTSEHEYNQFLQENYDLLTSETFQSLLNLVDAKLQLNKFDNQSVKDIFEFASTERKLSFEQYKELAHYVNLHTDAVLEVYRSFK